MLDVRGTVECELVKLVETMHVLETLASVAGLLCVEVGIWWRYWDVGVR